jgi:hypothetical protein
MSPKIIQHGGPLLSVLILAYILSYATSRGSFDGSLPYVVAAIFPNLFSFYSFLLLRRESRQSASATILRLLRRRAEVLFVVAWQLAIVGALNIVANNLVGAAGFVLSNLLLVMCLAISDRLVALADSADQEGGYKPFPFFGLPRSRRFLFWICVVYPSTILIGLGAVLFLKRKPYLTPLHPPQICLLVAAVFSAGTAGLVFQRYRGVAAGKGLTAACWLVALFIVGFAGAYELLLSSGAYVYVLSSISVVGTVLSAWSLLRGAGWSRHAV